MAGFDIIFEVFTLLLGLAVAEVLGGFASVLKMRARAKAGIDPDAARTRIGWLVPMLGFMVIAHQTSFWLDIYVMRETLPFNLLSVMGVLALVGYYYLVSAMIFPDEPEHWPDFDDYYMLHRRFIIGSIIVIAIVSGVAFTSFAPEPDTGNAPSWAVAATDWAAGVGALALVALLFVRSKRWNAVLLGVVLADFAIETALSVVVPYW